MYLFHLKLFGFIDNRTYSPEPAVGVGDTLAPLSKDGILDILNDESSKGDIIPLDDVDDDKDNKVKDKKDKVEDKKEEKENEDDEELKEIEEDLNEDEIDEDKLELVTPVRRREILAKYPEVFKDFPYLEKAYYREQQFTEVFPTVNDAKEASEAAKILTNFESDISQGNTKKLLSGLKDSNPKGFNKLVDNYLPTLLETDKDAYSHVVGNLTKNMVRGMISSARSESNEALEIAANLLYKWAFNTTKWEEPSNLSNDKDDIEDKKVDSVNEERQSIINERLTNAKSDLDEKLNNSIKSTIDAFIDPKDSMSAYVRKHATNECLETLNDLISKDKRFTDLVDRLWDKAIETKFSKDSLDTISRAFKSKAKTLLPAVIKQARREALKGSSVKTKDNDDNDTDLNDNVKQRSRNQTRDTNAPGKTISNAKGPKPGQSTADYFLED